MNDIENQKSMQIDTMLTGQLEAGGDGKKKAELRRDSRRRKLQSAK